MSELPPPTDPVAGHALSGRYVLEARIGSGGAGVVWRAHDEVLARRVAVKLLHPQLAHDPASAARFRAEATAAARLTHPNAVVVFDIGQEGDRDYLVMELVDGTDLTELFTGDPLPPPVVAYLGRAVAAALGTAHRAGLVHRDIKPANVLLTRDGVPKVADFGIARAVGAAMARLTRPGDVMGTARYVAPEQLRDEPLDGSADVYALGLVLHEALTGRAPWGEGTATEVAMRRLSSDLPPVWEIRDDVPPGLAAVLARATRLDPAERHEDGAELAAALAPFVADDAPARLAALAHAAVGRRRATDRAHRPTGGPDGAAGAAGAAGAGAAGAGAGAPAPSASPSSSAPPASRSPSPASSPSPAPPARTARAGDDVPSREDRTHVLGSAAPAARPGDRGPAPRAPGAAPGAPDAGAPAHRSGSHPTGARTGSAGGAAGPAAGGVDRAGGVPGTVTSDAPPLDGRTGRRKRSWILVALAVAVAATVGLLGILDTSPTTRPGNGGGGQSDVQVVLAGDHDPLGDDLEEWPDRVDRAVDGDDDSYWHTARYERADLIPPNKDGVGIWFDLGEPHDIERIDLELVVPGTSFEIWVGDDAPGRETRPDDWGTRVTEIRDADASQRVSLDDVDDTTGRVWLVWFTQLAPVEGGHRAHVADVRFRAR